MGVVADGLGSAGLRRDLGAGNGGARRRTGADDVDHHVAQRGSHFGAGGPPPRLWLGGPDEHTLAVAHLGDDMGLHDHAVVGDGRGHERDLQGCGRHVLLADRRLGQCRSVATEGLGFGEERAGNGGQVERGAFAEPELPGLVAQLLGAEVESHLGETGVARDAQKVGDGAATRAAAVVREVLVGLGQVEVAKVRVHLGCQLGGLLERGGGRDDLERRSRRVSLTEGAGEHRLAGIGLQ